MSVEAMAAVLHHSRAKDTALVVLLGIANHAGDGGAWPTVETLAKYGRCSDRTVQRKLAELVGLGELAVHPQAGGTRDIPDHRRPNRYDVLIACPAWCDGSVNHRNRGDIHRAKPATEALPGMPGVPESDRVTRVSPGDTAVTGTGDTGVTQTIPMNQAQPTSVENVTTTREAPRPADPEVVHRRAAEIRAALAEDRVRS